MCILIRMKIENNKNKQQKLKEIRRLEEKKNLNSGKIDNNNYESIDVWCLI